MAKKKEKRALDYNYAKDEEFSSELLSNLLETWHLVRQEREEREDIWQENYRAWSNDKLDAEKQYDGMADLSLPQIRKEIETMTRRIYKGLFPDDYLRAEPIRLEDEDLAIANTMMVRHYYDKVMNIKSFAFPWIKQGVIYGTSPARQFWHKKENEQFFKERYFVRTKEGILEPKTRFKQDKIVTYNAPELRAEDVFQTWVHPHNVDKPENIQHVFWRTKINKYQLKTKSQQGMCHKYEELKDTGDQRDWDFEESQERLQQFGQSGLMPALQDDGQWDLLEVWCNILLPGHDEPVPCVVEILDYAHVTRIQRNPYWHQKPPFDFMRFIIPPPGEFYGRGLPEASLKLQHQIDDTLNQTMDSATLALNNITVINPAYAPNAESFEVEPRAVWWADPNAVKQLTFPDLSGVGYTNVGILRGFVSELSDNQPQLPDPIAGKARSTGQAQLAINEWQTDLYTIIDMIATEALQPMAKKTHMLLQQNLEDDEIIRVSGKFSGSYINRVITPEEVVGNYNFSWLSSLQIENTAVKNQQMLNFMRMFQQIPPGEVKINWSNFIIKLLRDGFMIKDIHNIVETEHMNASTSPDIEYRILKLKGAIRVEDSDNDDAHLLRHAADLSKETDEYVKAKLEEHIRTHVESQQKKIVMVQQMQAAMAQQAPPQGAGGGPGNPQQIPESTAEDDLERGMGLGQ
jgi:hypothetical protein